MLYSQWLATPLTVRIAIAKQFGISKTGSTHVVNNEVVSDGYKIQDVERALNMEAIREYVGLVEGDLAALYDILVYKITHPEADVVSAFKHEAPADVVATPPSPSPKKKVAKKKAAKKKKA